MKTGQSALLFTAVLAALGYIGAGLFYGYLLGFNTQTPLTCPVCPHITGSGDLLHKFLARMLILGSLNALLLVSVGWCLRGLVVIAKRAIRY
jgi:hypothetical protein